MCRLPLVLVLATWVATPGLAARKARPTPVFAVDIKDLKLCAKPGSVTDMNITQAFTDRNRGSLFLGYIDVSRPAERWSEAKVVFHKCLGGISSNTCEYKSTWRFNQNPCGEFTSPLMPWNTIVAKFEPPYRCPFKAGRYVLHNATLNMEALSRLAGKEANQDITWVLKVDLDDERGRTFQCFQVAARLIRLSGKADSRRAKK
ncbi:hypothetical protein ONE63_003840 [Megalurothrips usitatus]|uniref:Uncharacterized protein n=1 Tax=Megalurothrips usitatus TaxID=439358 RepID=A0AAV7X6V0_9NEOP|nr:hypothetical protein ONE63_003840 [Megalurothrips usitatus]